MSFYSWKKNQFMFIFPKIGIRFFFCSLWKRLILGIFPKQLLWSQFITNVHSYMIIVRVKKLYGFPVKCLRCTRIMSRRSVLISVFDDYKLPIHWKISKHSPDDVIFNFAVHPIQCENSFRKVVDNMRDGYCWSKCVSYLLEKVLSNWCHNRKTWLKIIDFLYFNTNRVSIIQIVKKIKINLSCVFPELYNWNFFEQIRVGYCCRCTYDWSVDWSILIYIFYEK